MNSDSMSAILVKEELFLKIIVTGTFAFEQETTIWVPIIPDPITTTLIFKIYLAFNHDFYDSPK
jgi:hypothetical protein